MESFGTLLALAVSFRDEALDRPGEAGQGAPVRLIDNRILVPLP